MKTKKEIIKIYNAYLPYKLKILTQEYSDSKILSGVSFYDDSLYFDQDDRWCDVTEAKPYLYSMEILAKEIEHNGEKKILAKELFAGKWKEISEYYARTNQILKLSYDCIQALLEHHFNVFGLDESEYIKKESVIQK